MENECCSLCGRAITNEEAPILTLGGYGVPRYLCDECSAQIDKATSSREPEEITAAIDSLGEKLNAADHDHATAEELTRILYSSAKRCKEIKEGSYDFSLDEQSEDQELDDIPEEMLESEEDKRLDEEEGKKNKKLERVLNIVSAIIFAALGAFFVYRLMDLFLF